MYNYSLTFVLLISLVLLSCNSSLQSSDTSGLQMTQRIPAEMIEEQKPDLRNRNIPVEKQRPRFYAYECEQISDAEDRHECSNKELLTFIYGNLRYPSLARTHRVEGTVIIQFMVATDGTFSDFKATRDIGTGCGKEAIRVLSSMPPFIPAYAEGQPVEYKFTMPVKFKLE